MILTILGLSSLMVLLQNFQVYQQLLRKLNLDRKPFNCTLCSSFWYTLPVTIVTHGVSNGILLSGIVSIVSELIDRKLNDF